MRDNVCQSRRPGLALAAAVVALGFGSDVDASSPNPSAPEPARLATTGRITSAPQGQTWELAYQQRRGRMSVPQRPVAVDSSPMIDTLNKALKALNATNLDYAGHREKAINHIEAAIRKLQVPTANANAKGKSKEAVADTDADAKAETAKADSAKADSGDAVAKTAPTPQEESDATMRKAKAVLFDVHHKLTDKASTAGRIHADADVRIAIDEVTLALKPSAPATTHATTPAAAPAAAPAARTPARPGTAK